jgi:serine/threonine protein kinase
MAATGRCLTQQQVAAALSGCVEALQYLHMRNKVHRDVKAGNLLLSSDGIVKLADVRSACRAHLSQPSYRCHTPPPPHAAAAGRTPPPGRAPAELDAVERGRRVRACSLASPPPRGRLRGGAP